MDDFKSLHRHASEYLLGAVGQSDDRLAMAELRRSESCGTQALLAATTTRQRMLAMGLLQTVYGIRILIETGLETVRYVASNS